MRGFKDSYKGQAKVKTRKNRNSKLDSVFYTFFQIYKDYPEFMNEDAEFNIDAELEADFIKAV
jgi:hypothetical protein